jgi:Holliday junction resolvasome RuvABC endonuclease subunit
MGVDPSRKNTGWGIIEALPARIRHKAYSGWINMY